MLVSLSTAVPYIHSRAFFDHTRVYPGFGEWERGIIPQPDLACRRAALPLSCKEATRWPRLVRAWSTRQRAPTRTTDFTGCRWPGSRPHRRRPRSSLHRPGARSNCPRERSFARGPALMPGRTFQPKRLAFPLCAERASQPLPSAPMTPPSRSEPGIRAQSWCALGIPEIPPRLEEQVAVSRGGTWDVGLWPHHAYSGHAVVPAASDQQRPRRWLQAARLLLGERTLADAAQVDDRRSMPGTGAATSLGLRSGRSQSRHSAKSRCPVAGPRRSERAWAAVPATVEVVPVSGGRRVSSSRR